MLWHILIEPAPASWIRKGELLTAEAAESGLAGSRRSGTARLSGRGPLGKADVERAAQRFW